MNDFIEVLGIASTLALAAVPPILIARLIAGSEPIDLGEVLSVRAEMAWPRGVQEEDPPRWRFETTGASRVSTDVRLRRAGTLAGCRSITIARECAKPGSRVSRSPSAS